MTGQHGRPRSLIRRRKIDFEEKPAVRKLDTFKAVVDQERADRLSRWSSAMLRTWASGDVHVGVTRNDQVSLFTMRDSSTVPNPAELATALAAATAFVSARVARTA